MVATTITAVLPTAAGHVTVFPCDERMPTASNVNYMGGDVVPNFALTRLSGDGTVCIRSHATTDVIVDVVGYVPMGSSMTALPSPVRARDTRRSGPTVQPGAPLRIPLAGRFGVPGDADTVLFNLTAVQASAPGHATVYPCGLDDPPTTSSINYIPGRTVANFVATRLGDGGAVCIDVHSPVDLIVDVAGSSRGGLVTLDEPRRVVDSRRLLGVAGPIYATRGLRVEVAGRHGVPSTATAAVYNLTAVNAATPGHLTSTPCGSRPGSASNLNAVPERTVAGTTITGIGDHGAICVSSHGRTDVIVDLIGYVPDDSAYVPLTPARLWDTRRGWHADCRWRISSGPNSVELTIADLDSDAERKLAVSAIPNSIYAPAAPRIVRHDCRTVVTALGSLLRYSHADGTASTDPIDAAEDWWPLRLFEVNGRLVATSPGQLGIKLHDVLTQDVVWDHSDFNPWGSTPTTTELDISPSGFAARVVDLPDERRVEVWRIADDSLVADFVVPDDVVHMEIGDAADRILLVREVEELSGRFVVEVRSPTDWLASRHTIDVDEEIIERSGGVRAWFGPNDALVWCVPESDTFEEPRDGAMRRLAHVFDRCPVG